MMCQKVAIKWRHLLCLNYRQFLSNLLEIDCSQNSRQVFLHNQFISSTRQIERERKKDDERKDYSI